jgi:hypothetical protein
MYGHGKIRWIDWNSEPLRPHARSQTEAADLRLQEVQNEANIRLLKEATPAEAHHGQREAIARAKSVHADGDNKWPSAITNTKTRWDLESYMNDVGLL